MGDMVDSGQVELLTGGFYEPILPAIPDRDKIGQINKLNHYLKDHFEVESKGMWLAERVWEPHLPETMHRCGVRYVPLDDTHFKYAGMTEEQLFGTYMTEEAGKELTLFPILQNLRYLIPFGEVDQIIEFLRTAANTNPGGMAVYADDGEKFGIWPETYHHCYEDGWLRKFFEALSQNSDWLEVVGMGDAFADSKPLGRVYLPSASYKEMLEWSLPAEGVVALEEFEEKLKELDLDEKYSRFVRGGHWRGFLTKYEEANLMHKKMLAVSDLLQKAEKDKKCDREAVETARDLLYAGQCNCPYWHGVFGGLYLPHLRWAVYQKLTEAERILREQKKCLTTVEFTDRNRDGFDEIILSGRKIGMVVNPHQGGRIDELSLWEKNVNLADVLSRRREGYHHKLLNAPKNDNDDGAKSIHEKIKTKEEGLEKLLAEDWYLRRPLIDHFLADDVDLKKYLLGKFRDLGDFVLEPYDSSFEETDSSYELSLYRQGRVWHGDFYCPLTLEKKICLPKDGYDITIDYCLSQREREIMNINFAVEFCFNLLAPEAEDRFALINGVRPDKNYYLAAMTEDRPVKELAFYDEYQQLGIALTLDEPATLWRMPIYTISLSEGGFEKNYQGHVAVFKFDKSLAAQEEYRIRFKLTAAPLGVLKSRTNDNKTKTARV